MKQFLYSATLSVHALGWQIQFRTNEKISALRTFFASVMRTLRCSKPLFRRPFTMPTNRICIITTILHGRGWWNVWFQSHRKRCDGIVLRVKWSAWYVWRRNGYWQPCQRNAGDTECKTGWNQVRFVCSLPEPLPELPEMCILGCKR